MLLVYQSCYTSVLNICYLIGRCCIFGSLSPGDEQAICILSYARKHVTMHVCGMCTLNRYNILGNDIFTRLCGL